MSLIALVPAAQTFPALGYQVVPNMPLEEAQLGSRSIVSPPGACTTSILSTTTSYEWHVPPPNAIAWTSAQTDLLFSPARLLGLKDLGNSFVPLKFITRSSPYVTTNERITNRIELDLRMGIYYIEIERKRVTLLMDQSNAGSRTQHPMALEWGLVRENENKNRPAEELFLYENSFIPFTWIAYAAIRRERRFMMIWTCAFARRRKSTWKQEFK